MARTSKRPQRASQADRLPRIRRTYLWIIAAVALIGLGDAIYLTAAHIAGLTSICGDAHGCSEVLSSSYASFRGIPTATFGAVGYFVAFSAAILSLFGYRGARGLLVVGVAVMFAATLWFLYLQAAVLHAFCPFCLLSAACVFCLAGLLIASPPLL